MKIDALSLFNTGLVETIVSKNDEDLWSFLVEHEERIKRLFDDGKYPKTNALFAYPHGIEWFRKHYLQYVEQDRAGMIYTLVLDFCLRREIIKLDYWGQAGFLDNADSCSVQTSEEIMPPIGADSESAFYKERFGLLEPRHIRHIIEALEKNFDKLTVNTREDIDKIKEMRRFCLHNAGYNVAYIYND